MQTLELDSWQKEVLDTVGNVLLVSGRQVGKSTIISHKAGNFACKNKEKSVLIISATERQAEELFIKTLNFIQDNFRYLIKIGKDRPTKHIIRLKNGSIVRCLPTGLAGTGIRGFTVHMLIADEAAFIPEEVWSAVTPMLLTTGGDIILVSTPHGRQGYFYTCYNDKSFKVFHVNSEKVITERLISQSWSLFQKEKALEHLEREKKSMSELQYAQEYMGEFIDALRQFFKDDLIKKVMVLKRPIIRGERAYFLGVDIARLGEDEGVFSIIDRTNRDMLEQVENIITLKKRLNETTNEVLRLDKLYNFKKIYIDDGGIGTGVFDYLLENPQTKNKVIAINNRARPLDKD